MVSGAMRFLFDVLRSATFTPKNARLTKPGRLSIPLAQPKSHIRRERAEIDIPIHATLQILLAQLSALVIVNSAEAAQAFEILLHDGLTFGVMI